MSERTLHVYEMEEDWVVAYDPDDAWTIWCEQTGESRADYEGSFEPVVWTRSLSITDEDGATTEATAAQWVESNGRGFLCSSNY